MKEQKFYKSIYLAATKIQFRSTFNIRHPQKGFGTQENDIRRKTLNTLKSFDVW